MHVAWLQADGAVVVPRGGWCVCDEPIPAQIRLTQGHEPLDALYTSNLRAHVGMQRCLHIPASLHQNDINQWYTFDIKNDASALKLAS